MTRIRGLKEVIERDEAVSPIIATILLVAITVILASTLYLALGGFFKSGTSASPTATVSVTNSTSSTAPGYVYSVSVGTPTSAVALSNVILKITFSNGTIGSTTALSTTGQKIYENGVSPGWYVTIDVTPTTGNIGPSTTITIIPTGDAGITSVQVVDTGSNGGVMGSGSVS